MSPLTILTGSLVICLASLTCGLAGFGFALVSVPLLINFVLPQPQVVVPTVLLLTNLSNCIVLIKARTWIDVKRIWLLGLAGVLATPLGTYLLVVLDTHALNVFIGVVTSLSALALMLGLRRPIRNEKLALLPVGVLSGLLSGSTAMGGPPVVLFMTNQGTEKQVFRANLTLYFTLLGLSTIPSQIVGGLLTKDVVVYALGALPALTLGTLAGIELARRTREEVFRKLALVIVVASGVVAVASGWG
jgi:hypothetical protein